MRITRVEITKILGTGKQIRAITISRNYNYKLNEPIIVGQPKTLERTCLK